MTRFDLPDVIHLPLEAGQRAPRHVLQSGVTAAPCGVCDRVVIRWSLMGDRDRALYAQGIRAQMVVADVPPERRIIWWHKTS